jgi:hypothetical protein
MWAMAVKGRQLCDVPSVGVSWAWEKGGADVLKLLLREQGNEGR